MKDSEKNYDDIIDLPHHISSKHPQMSRQARAAQFAPFAALTGYEDALEEVRRTTEQKPEPDEERVRRINSRLNYLLESISSKPEIKVEYFVKDKLKQGGENHTYSGKLRTIDQYQKLLIFEDEKGIPIDDIYDITGECFEFEE